MDNYAGSEWTLNLDKVVGLGPEVMEAFFKKNVMVCWELWKTCYLHSMRCKVFCKVSEIILATPRDRFEMLRLLGHCGGSRLWAT
jgi:hypothetical protein